MKKQLILLLFLIVSIGINAQTVYKTPSGKKYHTGNCRTVRNSSQALSVAEARDLGLEPCKICRPPSTSFKSQSLKSSTNTVSGEKASTTQCQGTTKKGSRCKHRTSIGNGYCFQHQP